MAEENFLLKANSLLNSYVVEKQENQDEIMIQLQGQTLIFKEIEADILNLMLKEIQQSLFYGNIDDYQKFNPFSISLKELKNKLNLKSNASKDIIKEGLIGLKNKNVILRNFTHPDRYDEKGNNITYAEYYTSIFSTIGFRNGSENLDNLELIGLDSIVDIELDSIFYLLIKRPTIKKFSKYELFYRYKKKQQPFLNEEEIKKEFDILIEENKAEVSYTLLNINSIQSLKSKYSKKIYELIAYKISYQTKSKKTVEYNYFDYKLFELNLLLGTNENGMSYLNKIFKRNFEEAKELLVRDLNLSLLEYESFNSEQKIIIKFQKK